MIRPLDRAKIFTGVSKGLFPWRRYEIIKRRRWCVDGPD
jgi:hypothetical protein